MTGKLKARRVWLECKKCGSRKITATKRVVYSDWDEAIIRETMMHDGFGWDLNTFDFKCAECGSDEIQVNWNENEEEEVKEEEKEEIWTIPL